MSFVLKSYLGSVISFPNIESIGQEEDLWQRTYWLFRSNISSPSSLMRSDNRCFTVWRRLIMLQNSDNKNVTEDTSWRTQCRPILRTTVIHITSDKLTVNMLYVFCTYDVECVYKTASNGSKEQ